jgi:hypothetical protein
MKQHNATPLKEQLDSVCEELAREKAAHRETRRLLREHEVLYKALIDNSPVPLWKEDCLEEICGRETLDQLLVRKNHELEDFSLKVSHELKNNLLVIQRLAECVHLKPDSVTRFAEDLMSRTERMTR